MENTVSRLFYASILEQVMHKYLHVDFDVINSMSNNVNPIKPIKGGGYWVGIWTFAAQL